MEVLTGVGIRSEQDFEIAAVAAIVVASETAVEVAAVVGAETDERVADASFDATPDEVVDEGREEVDEETDAVVGEVDGTSDEGTDARGIRKERDLEERKFHLAKWVADHCSVDKSGSKLRECSSVGCFERKC